MRREYVAIMVVPVEGAGEPSYEVLSYAKDWPDDDAERLAGLPVTTCMGWHSADGGSKRSALRVARGLGKRYSCPILVPDKG